MDGSLMRLQQARAALHETATLGLLLDSVADRLSDAARTLTRLRVAGMGPSQRMVMADLVFISGDVQQGYGYVSVGGARLTPSAAAIDQLDQVLKWIYGAPLTIPARRLLWLRAEGRGWRSMAAAVGSDPSTTKRHYQRALEVFVGHLIEKGLLL